MTKPGKIAAGIGVAALACAALAIAAAGAARWVALWTSAACAVACGAYVGNRPGWLGKRDGRFGVRALAVLPYLIAFRIACALMRWWRGGDAPTEVAPGVWVAGRVRGGELPAGVAVVVDLVAEYPEPAAVRRLAGYRSLPLLDGGFPPDVRSFLLLLDELADGIVLVHCDSGRGRAPTVAAALLVTRGVAPDVITALARIRAARPVAVPTRSDVRFLETVEPLLQMIAARQARPARMLDTMEGR